MGVILWLVTESNSYPRVEYGPYLTRDEAQSAANRRGLPFLVRYDTDRSWQPVIERVSPARSRHRMSMRHKSPPKSGATKRR